MAHQVKTSERNVNNLSPNLHLTDPGRSDWQRWVGLGREERDWHMGTLFLWRKLSGGIGRGKVKPQEGEEMKWSLGRSLPSSFRSSSSWALSWLWLLLHQCHSWKVQKGDSWLQAVCRSQAHQKLKHGGCFRNRHRRRCSSSIISKEMQIKTTMRYCLTLVRMAIIKKSIIYARESMGKREPSSTVGRNVNWCSHYGEQYGGSSKN